MFDLLNGGHQGQIAHRPNIGPAQGHEQIDIGRPRADAFELEQAIADGGIVPALECLEIELAVQNCLCQMATIAGLLPAKANGFEMVIVQFEKSFRCQRIDRRA